MRRDQHFQNLLNVLRRQIDVSFSSGEALPGERALASMHGVGPTTIHRALNVLSTEERIHSRPRVGWIKSGVSRSSQRANHRALTIGIISRRPADTWSESEIYAMLEKEAERRRVNVIRIPNHHAWPTSLQRYEIELARVPWNAFDVGLIVEAEETLRSRHPMLLKRKMISVDENATSYGLDSVVFADYEAGEIAARHLLELGHLRFAVTDEVNDIGYPHDPAHLLRRHGFESAIGKAGGMLLPQWRLPVPRRSRVAWTGHGMFEGGHRDVVKKTVAAWAAAPRALRPTALFALHPHPVQDGLLAQELARHGLKIPRDLSVITTTWGGQFFGGASTKIEGLTYAAVDFDLAALVKRTFDLAEATAWDEAPPGQRPQRLFFAPAKLISGKSTAPPYSE